MLQLSHEPAGQAVQRHAAEDSNPSEKPAAIMIAVFEVVDKKAAPDLEEAARLLSAADPVGAQISVKSKGGPGEARRPSQGARSGAHRSRMELSQDP